MRTSRHASLLLILAALAALAGCNSKKPTIDAAQAQAAAKQAPSAWTGHVQHFEEQYFAANPAFAVSQGRHEFDGRLPDWSKHGIEQQIEWLGAARNATVSYDDSALSPQERFEKQYLLAVIDGDLFWLKDAQRPFLNPAYYVSTPDPSVYITRPYAPPQQRLQAFIAYLKAVPEAAAQIRANLRVPMPRSFVDYGVAAFDGYAGFYQSDAIAAFALVKDEDLQAQLKQASAAASKAMRSLAGWFKSERKRATDAYAIGPEKFSRMLAQTERVDTPLDRLAAIGQADLERNTHLLAESCAKYRPDQGIAACVAAIARGRVKTRFSRRI